MRSYIKNAVAALLAIVIVLSTTYMPVAAVSDIQYNYSGNYNSGKRDEVATTLNGTSALSYYGSNYDYEKLSALSADALKTALATLMQSTHSYKSTYDDCHYKANRTDCQNEDGSVSLIYTNYSATMNQWNGWNREHVWPQSLGGGNTSGGGADLHHIRPSDASVNSSRGNKKYGEVTNGSTVKGNNPATGYVGGTSNSAYFEPNDNVKGDLARIVLYVWVRWGSAWGADSVTEVFQSVDVLLEWHKNDPVDTWELGRNEVIQNIQGNRNVFIDYPEYAWLIFGREVPADVTTPSSGNYTGGGNQGGGNTTPSCTHQTTVIKNAVAAECYNDGYTGDVYCSDCDELVTKGSVIPSKNAHNFGDWELNDDGDYVKHCTKCDAIAILDFDTLLADVNSDAEKILILLTLGVSDSVILDSLAK